MTWVLKKYESFAGFRARGRVIGVIWMSELGRGDFGRVQQITLTSGNGLAPASDVHHFTETTSIPFSPSLNR